MALLMRRGPSLGRVPAAPVPRRPRYYACATTPCTASLRLISSPAGTTLRLLIRSLSPAGRGGPGPLVSAGGPCSGACTGTVQGLPGSLASPPVALRTVFDPGRSDGASPVAAPPVLPPLFRRRRHRQLLFRGSIASLHHPLCTLHDMRYRTPCNTRSRLAGSASAGRVSNPLARGEKFQLIASSYLVPATKPLIFDESPEHTIGYSSIDSEYYIQRFPQAENWMRRVVGCEDCPKNPQNRV